MTTCGGVSFARTHGKISSTAIAAGMNRPGSFIPKNSAMQNGSYVSQLT
jgi:hypothetical protein